MGVGSPASVLFDENGNPVGVVLDGSSYRLRSESKLVGGSGNVEMAVAHDTAIPGSTFGLLALGDDGGTARRHQMRTTHPALADAGLVVRNVERTLPTFYAVFDRITMSDGKYIATVFNTSSTRKIVLQRLWVYNWQVNNVPGRDVSLAWWRITARTVGTAVTVRSEDSDDSLSSGISADTNSSAVTQAFLMGRIMTSGKDIKWVATRLHTILSLPVNALRYERRFGQRGHTFRENQGFSLQVVDSQDNDGSVSVVAEFTDEEAS